MTSIDELFDGVLENVDSLPARLSREAADDAESDALATIVREVRALARKHVDPAAIERRGALGGPLLEALSASGLFGLTIPERFGGSALSLKAAARVVTELASFDGSVATCVGLHSGLALHALLHCGAPELQARYLPDVASGRRIASFAATESGAGSDIAAVRTTLSESDGGLRLDGGKCYVTNGGICGLITVLARSPGLGGARAGHTLVLVDPAWPGVTRGREEHKLGLRGSSTITLDFDRVSIPRDHLLGEVSQGLDHAHAALSWGRTMLSAGCLGTARAALADVQAHVEQRSQFGRLLSAQPLVRGTLAAAAADLYAAESVVRLACERGTNDAGALRLPSLVAKVLTSETAWSVVDRCVQLMGAAGYLEDVGMARRLRDVRVTRIFEGSNDVLRLHLAASCLAGARNEDATRPALARLLAPMHVPRAERVDDHLARMFQTLRGIERAHGFRLFQQQSLQVAMADAIIAAYALVAVTLRASSVHEAREAAVASLGVQRQARRLDRALAATADADAHDPALVEAILRG